MRESSSGSEGLQRGAEFTETTKVQWAIRSFAALTGSLNAVGTFAIFGLMVLINIDIFSRFLFNAPVRGVAEIVSLSIVGIVFLQAPHALGQGSIARTDVLYRWLQKRKPKATRYLDALYALIGAALFAILARAAWQPFIRAWEGNLFVGVPGDFTAPTWPVKLLIVIGAAALSLQFLVLFIKALTSNQVPQTSSDTGEQNGNE